MVSDKIVDSVIDMYEDGFEIEDIKMYISDLLEIENYELEDILNLFKLIFFFYYVLLSLY